MRRQTRGEVWSADMPESEGEHEERDAQQRVHKREREQSRKESPPLHSHATGSAGSRTAGKHTYTHRVFIACILRFSASLLFFSGSGTRFEFRETHMRTYRQMYEWGGEQVQKARTLMLTLGRRGVTSPQASRRYEYHGAHTICMRSYPPASMLTSFQG